MSKETNYIDLNLAGRTVKAREVTRKVKGKEGEYVSYIPEFKSGELIPFLTDTLGVEVLEAALVRELIRPAANAASSAAIKEDPETGEPQFDEETYTKTFLDDFQATSRGGGLKLKDITTKIHELQPRFMELTALSMQRQKEGSYLNEQEMLEFANLLAEMEKLNKAYEEKSRGGKKGAGKKSKKSKKAQAESAEEEGNPEQDNDIPDPSDPTHAQPGEEGAPTGTAVAVAGQTHPAARGTVSTTPNR